MVIIDTGKGLDPLEINALAAAQEVIVMVSPGRLELDAIARMQEDVKLVREEVLMHASEPVVRGILLTLADPYSITRDTVFRIEKQFPGLLFSLSFPRITTCKKQSGAPAASSKLRQRAREPPPTANSSRK
ncbi:MAG: ParA family protein [Anaerolineales bacterium]|nr:ParA family protein [Anaerolineales bacterium]